MSAGPDAVEILIEGLEVHGRHGVLEAERALGQRFLVDLRLELAECEGVASDRLADTVDYARVAEEVASVVAGPPVELLERLAGMIADGVLAHPHVAAVTVTIRKPHVALPQRVGATGVVLRRARGA